MVLQDTHTDYQSNIYSIITDIHQGTSQFDSIIWDFLHLVQIDDFIQQELKSDLNQPIENK